LRPWLIARRDAFAQKGVAYFASLKTEVDTRPIDRLLQDLSLRRFLPNYDKKHPDLWFYEVLSGKELPPGKSEIYPTTAVDHTYAEHVSFSKIGLVIVPAIAFDAHGNRLGRGQGYYDRFLAALKKEEPTAMTMVIGLDLQLLNEVPVEVHDQGLAWYCTPKSGVCASSIVGDIERVI